jgi:hypothetical protein
MISNAPFLCLAPYFRASLMAPSLASAPEIGEEHLVEAALFDEGLRQLQAGAVVEGGARRQQKPGLRRQRIGDDDRRVTEAVDGPALHEVEVTLAGIVP